MQWNTIPRSISLKCRDTGLATPGGGRYRRLKEHLMRGNCLNICRFEPYHAREIEIYVLQTTLFSGSHTLVKKSRLQVFCSRLAAGRTVRFHHDVVQVWPGLSHIRGDQRQPFLTPRVRVLPSPGSSLALPCCSVSHQRARERDFLYSPTHSCAEETYFVKLCPAKYIMYRMVRFVRALDHLPPKPATTNASGRRAWWIHHSDGEILRRTATLSVRPRASEPNGTTEPSCSQFRAPPPLPAPCRCAAACVLDHVDSRSPPRCRNIERELALLVLVCLLKRRGNCEFSPRVCRSGRLRRGGPLRVYRTAPLRPRRPSFMQTKGLGRPWLRCGLAGWPRRWLASLGIMKHPSPFYSCLLKTICLNIATDVKPRRLSFVGRGEGRPKGYSQP